LENVPETMTVVLGPQAREHRLEIGFPGTGDLVIELIPRCSTDSRLLVKATARVRYHLADRIKQAGKEYAKVRAECKNVLGRLPK
jgi:hypothetical protein